MGFRLEKPSLRTGQAGCTLQLGIPGHLLGFSGEDGVGSETMSYTGQCGHTQGRDASCMCGCAQDTLQADLARQQAAHVWSVQRPLLSSPGNCTLAQSLRARPLGSRASSRPASQGRRSPLLGAWHSLRGPWSTAGGPRSASPEHSLQGPIGLQTRTGVVLSTQGPVASRMARPAAGLVPGSEEFAWPALPAFLVNTLRGLFPGRAHRHTGQSSQCLHLGSRCPTSGRGGKGEAASPGGPGGCWPAHGTPRGCPLPQVSPWSVSVGGRGRGSSRPGFRGEGQTSCPHWAGLGEVPHLLNQAPWPPGEQALRHPLLPNTIPDPPPRKVEPVGGCNC